MTHAVHIQPIQIRWNICPKSTLTCWIKKESKRNRGCRKNLTKWVLMGKRFWKSVMEWDGITCNWPEELGGGGGLYGIDLTPENLLICKKHLELNGYSSELIIGDAEELPYQDDTFDFVYTFGVIHHTPDMEKCIREIHRILKPGGKCWVGVYNKNSWFYRCYLVPEYIRRKQYKEMSMKERLSLIEYPNTNKDILVRLTTKKELKKMFQGFHILEMKNRSLTRDSFIGGGRMVSDRMLRILSRRLGWYNIVIAQK